MKRLFFVMLFLTSLSANACNIERYVADLRERIDSFYYPKIENSEIDYTKTKIAHSLAKDVINTSQYCINNISNEDDKEALLEIKRLAENLEYYSSSYLNAVGGGINHLKESLGKEEFDFLDFIGTIGQVSIDSSQIKVYAQNTVSAFEELLKEIYSK